MCGASDGKSGSTDDPTMMRRAGAHTVRLLVAAASHSAPEVPEPAPFTGLGAGGVVGAGAGPSAAPETSRAR